MLNLKRTKIITTIGPSSENIDMLRKFFDAGMTTIRLNFSHGTYEEHKKRILNARELMKEKQQPISIMLDTKGPEVRIGKVQNDALQINENAFVTIFASRHYFQKELGKNELSISYDISKDLNVGKIILVDDGKLQLEVIEIKPQVVLTKALNSHIVKTNKRVNLPGTNFTMPFLSKKDDQDIRFGIKNGIDFIAASFVNNKSQIEEIRQILKEEKAEHIQIFSKIESQYAVDNFDEILEATDGVMIARGDLGLEIPYYDVPVVQKMIIRKMRNAGKPVIVATQMLDSMEKSPSPTRAEVTDVYFATELGADATMLSGESAAGKFPEEAVHAMASINKRAETEFYRKSYYEKYIKSLPKPTDYRSAKAKEITLKAKDNIFKFVVVRSKTGLLLSQIAKYRPNLDIIGIVESKKLTTAFGITSSVFVNPDLSSYWKIKADHNAALPVVLNFGGKSGDRYLVVDNSGITEHIV